MKNISYLVYSLVLLLVFSCKKEEQQVQIGEVKAAQLSSSNPKNIVLLAENADLDTIQFNWEAADFGYAASIAYTLEFAAAADTAFANPIQVHMQSVTSYQATAGKFNELLGRLELQGEEAARLIYRIKASIAPSFPTAISQVEELQVTTFSTNVVYPKLYVPGSHQGWNPATAPTLSDITFKNIYIGYINLPDAQNEFKLTTVPDWSAADYGSTGTNKLVLSGGDNIQVAGPGHFLMTADLNTLTYKMEKMNFGVIGDAVGSWEVDQDLQYDLPTKTLRLTTALVAGGLKFRANDDWGINLGSSGKEHIIIEGGDNIMVSEAGTYEIILDLNNPALKTYQLVKK